jgi:hypothetical protein
MFCCLDYGILFGMEPATEFMALSRRDSQFFPQASNFEAVGNSGWRAVISGGKDVFVLYEDGANLPAQTCRATGHEMCYFHEIFIPAGTGHESTPKDNSLKILHLAKKVKNIGFLAAGHFKCFESSLYP